MDIISTAIGFLVGTATGAAGTYFADKYTDIRREKKAIKDQKKLWKDIERRFTEVISEMRSDITSEQGRYVRTFFVKTSTSTIGFVSEPCFEYHTDKLPSLRAAVVHLEETGFIKDITPGNCPMYRIQEKMIDHLIP